MKVSNGSATLSAKLVTPKQSMAIRNMAERSSVGSCLVNWPSSIYCGCPLSQTFKSDEASSRLAMRVTKVGWSPRGSVSCGQTESSLDVAAWVCHCVGEHLPLWWDSSCNMTLFLELPLLHRVYESMSRSWIGQESDALDSSQKALG